MYLSDSPPSPAILYGVSAVGITDPVYMPVTTNCPYIETTWYLVPVANCPLNVRPLSYVVSPFRPPQLSTLPAAATGTAINGATGDIAVAPARTAELVSVAAPASVGSAAGSVNPAYAGKLCTWYSVTVGLDYLRCVVVATILLIG